MDGIFEFLRSLSAEVWAIYIVGFVGFWITIRQLKKNFKLKKKADTFEDLSKKIQDASEFSRQIANTTESMIHELGAAADDMKFDATNKSQKDIENEINRRLKVLEKLQEQYSKHVDSIDTNTYNILSIIKAIEKSTVVKEKTRISARYLYYEAQEQYALMKSANSILATLQVVPLIGEKPSVSPETFNAIRELAILISRKNDTISSYLDDLEIILHNDLVKGIYGKAKNETLPVKHLGNKGISDSRTKSPLL